MLERLKQYKELIAILVFFLGGFAWIENRFVKADAIDPLTGAVDAVDMRIARMGEAMATRQDVDGLHCLLNAYMTITQHQMKMRVVEAEKAELERDPPGVVLAASHGGDGASAGLMHEVQNYYKTLDRLEGELHSRQREVENIISQLQRHECGDWE